MESYYNLTEIEKNKHPYFLFYLNLLSNEENKNYINSIFNVPKLPLIGTKIENNGNSHLLGKLLSLVSFQINICQGEQKDEIDQLFSDFTLPKNINEYLNIEEVIEIDNNTDEPNIHLYFMPKRKLNFYFIITELPIYPDKKNEKTNIINKNIIIDNEKKRRKFITEITSEFENIKQMNNSLSISVNKEMNENKQYKLTINKLTEENELLKNKIEEQINI